MKKILFRNAGFILAAGLILSSCSKLEDFGDTNVNPLAATDPITGALLTSAQINTIPFLSSGGSTGAGSSLRPGLFVQYFSETQYTETSLYQEPKLEFGIYHTGLMDLQRIIDLNSDAADAPKYAASGSAANQIAVAKILKSYIVWTLTDKWGDIPYAEAMGGKKTGNLTPKYDTQESIYKAMIADLTSAVEGFDGGPAVKGDIYFGGNAAKWKKVANTLRMMMAMRLSKVYPGAGEYAATEFSAAATDPAGFMTSNADNMVCDFPANSPYKHPWYLIYDGRNDYAYSKTLADILSNMADQRRSKFASAGNSFAYGLLRADASVITGYATVLANKQENADVIIIGAAPSLLTLAEGVERGWVTATATGYTAQQAYEAGVRASFEQWGLPDANATSVLTGPGNYVTGAGGGANIGNTVAFNQLPGQTAVTTTALQRIALQMYLAHYPDGIQAWSNWRRTNFPTLVPTTFAVNAGKGIPRRYVYGNNEYGTNQANVAEAVGRLTGGDQVDSKIWWDR